MKINSFLKNTDLESSLLIGYYGGGNFGDELLLEVLQNLLAQKRVQNVSIAYQNPENFGKFHHDFGYIPVQIHSKKELLKATLKNRNIVIGGGGLWGVDINLNTFFLSVFLLVSRWLFGKKVYLIGVGYYNSTTRLGRIGAWAAGKAARTVIVRDKESLTNFKAINKQTFLDNDIAYYTDRIDPSKYKNDVEALGKSLKVNKKTLFISLRRFSPKLQNNFNQLVAKCLDDNQDKPIILVLLELKKVDRESYATIKKWQKKYPKVQILSEPVNPIALFLFFRKHHRHLALIGPQFHIIVTAYLNSVRFLPISYDNKVSALLENIGVDELPINQLKQSDIQTFVDSFWGK